MHSDIRPKNTYFAGDFVDQASGDFAQSGRYPYDYYLTDYTDRHSAESPEEIYQELDGARARQGGLTWRLRIYAIHEVGAERWIQLAAAGATVYELVVQATHAARSCDVIASIEAWLADPVSTSRVIRLQ